MSVDYQSSVPPDDLLEEIENASKCVEFLETNDDSAEKFNTFLFLLNTKSHSDEEDELWVSLLIEHGGLESLFVSLDNIIQKFTDGDVTVVAVLVPFLKCIHKLTSFPDFLGYIIDNDDEQMCALFGSVLTSQSLMAKQDILRLLSCCMIEDSSAVNMVNKVFEGIAENENALFQLVIQDLESEDDYEYLAELMGFINSYVMCGNDVSQRMDLRNQFNKLGLLSILDDEIFTDLARHVELNDDFYNEKETLRIHLEVFNLQRQEDEMAFRAETVKYDTLITMLSGEQKDQIDLIMDKLATFHHQTSKDGAEESSPSTHKLFELILNIAEKCSAMKDQPEVLEDFLEKQTDLIERQPLSAKELKRQSFRSSVKSTPRRHQDAAAPKVAAARAENEVGPGLEQSVSKVNAWLEECSSFQGVEHVKAEASASLENLRASGQGGGMLAPNLRRKSLPIISGRNRSEHVITENSPSSCNEVSVPVPNRHARKMAKLQEKHRVKPTVVHPDSSSDEEDPQLAHPPALNVKRHAALDHLERILVDTEHEVEIEKPNIGIVCSDDEIVPETRTQKYDSGLSLIERARKLRSMIFKESSTQCALEPEKISKMVDTSSLISEDVESRDSDMEPTVLPVAPPLNTQSLISVDLDEDDAFVEKRELSYICDSDNEESELECEQLPEEVRPSLAELVREKVSAFKSKNSERELQFSDVKMIVVKPREIAASRVRSHSSGSTSDESDIEPTKLRTEPPLWIQTEDPHHRHHEEEVQRKTWTASLVSDDELDAELCEKPPTASLAELIRLKNIMHDPKYTKKRDAATQVDLEPYSAPQAKAVNFVVEKPAIKIEKPMTARAARKLSFNHAPRPIVAHRKLSLSVPPNIYPQTPENTPRESRDGSRKVSGEGMDMSRPGAALALSFAQAWAEKRENNGSLKERMKAAYAKPTNSQDTDSRKLSREIEIAQENRRMSGEEKKRKLSGQKPVSPLVSTKRQSLLVPSSPDSRREDDSRSSSRKHSLAIASKNRASRLGQLKQTSVDSEKSDDTLSGVPETGEDREPAKHAAAAGRSSGGRRRDTSESNSIDIAARVLLSLDKPSETRGHSDTATADVHPVGENRLSLPPQSPQFDELPPPHPPRRPLSPVYQPHLLSNNSFALSGRMSSPKMRAYPEWAANVNGAADSLHSLTLDQSSVQGTSSVMSTPKPKKKSRSILGSIRSSSKRKANRPASTTLDYPAVNPQRGYPVVPPITPEQNKKLSKKIKSGKESHKTGSRLKNHSDSTTSISGRSRDSKTGGSLTKIKTLFTKRSYDPHGSIQRPNKHGQVEPEMSSMSKPFFNSGIDDVTVVKDERNAWQIAPEDEKVKSVDLENSPETDL